MSIKSKLINEFILLKEIKVELSKFYDNIYQKKVKTTFPSLSSKAYISCNLRENTGNVMLLTLHQFKVQGNYSRKYI